MSQEVGPPRVERPATVDRAVALLVALVGVGLVVTVLVVAFRDDLDAAWTAGHPKDSAIKPLSFVPVVLVLYVVVGGLTLVLLPFLRTAHNWARHSLAGMVVFLALATLGGARTGLPVLFLALSVAVLVLFGAILYLLWHPDTTRFVTGPPPGPHADGGDSADS